LHLSGYKVLKAIKLINPGIQVIIFTASNKVWSLLELQANGADGFLLKESPELTINSSYTYESLSSLCKQMTFCLSNAYLKDIWSLFDEIRKVFSKNPLTTKYFPRLLKEQLNGIKYQNLLLQELDAIFEILKTNNENRYSMAMIMLYKILEYLNEIFYQKVAWDKPPIFYDNVPVDYFDKNSKKWKKPTDRLDYYNKEKRATEQIRIKPEWLKSTSNKTLNLAVKKLNLTDDSILIDLISLSDYRNDFIHSDSSKRSKLKVLQSKEILKWSTSVTSIIKNL
jgi:CheY-like chemotaxis protein